MTFSMMVLKGSSSGDQAMVQLDLKRSDDDRRIGMNALCISVMVKRLPFVSSAEKG